MENPPRRAKPAYPIESVDNALELLLLFREASAVRVSEAAERLGVARSTAHRLLAMLQYRGFIEQDATSRAYVAGPALLDTGLAAVRQMDSWRISRPVIERLSRELDESVHFGILQGTEVLFVDGVESTRPLRAGSRVGVRLPAHCTAAGKAMLARLSTEEVRTRFPPRLAPKTSRSLTRRTALEAELEEVRRVGYATNFGESEDDLVALAAAVEPRGCVVVTAPASRATGKAWVSVVAGPTVEAALEIGASLEGRRPPSQGVL
jgi:IclR family transcriptional regulator, acetate operon repressor